MNHNCLVPPGVAYRLKKAALAENPLLPELSALSSQHSPSCKGNDQLVTGRRRPQNTGLTFFRRPFGHRREMQATALPSSALPCCSGPGRSRNWLAAALARRQSWAAASPKAHLCQPFVEFDDHNQGRAYNNYTHYTNHTKYTETTTKFTRLPLEQSLHSPKKLNPHTLL